MLTGKLTAFMVHRDILAFSGITNSGGTLGATCNQENVVSFQAGTKRCLYWEKMSAVLCFVNVEKSAPWYLEGDGRGGVGIVNI